VTGSTLTVYVDANGRERSFCRRCGASLFWAIAGGDGVCIGVGALDGATGLVVDRHIHVDSAADWEPFPQGAPAHREGSTSPVLPPVGE
jgi:hypothetical protein